MFGSTFRTKLNGKLLFILWFIVCASVGAGFQFASRNDYQVFTGLWSGSSLIEYPTGLIKSDINILVHDDVMRINAIFDPLNEGNVFSTETTADLLASERNQLNLVLKAPNYSNRDEFEKKLGRKLPHQGQYITGKAWAINVDEVFIYLQLAFGENAGVYVQRVK